MWKLRSLVHSTSIQEIIILVLFTALYGIHVVHLAVTQPIWLDEWFTMCVATMPTLEGLFDLIWSGPDVHPPLFYLITRSITRTLGENDFTLRLPAIIGFWVFCLSLYAFVRLSGGGIIAASVAMMLPRATNYYFFGREARPYGLVLGCIGLGLVFWQLKHSEKYRKYGVLGLVLTLSLAACLHYFAIFSVGIFYITEVFIFIREKKMNFMKFIYQSTIYLIPLIFFFLHLPILYHKSKTIPYWKDNIQVNELLSMYYSPFLKGRFALLLVFILFTYFLQKNKLVYRNNYNLIIFSILFLLAPCVFFLAVLILDKTFFLDRYVIYYITGPALVLTMPVWSAKIDRVISFIFLLTALVYIAHHESDFIFPWVPFKTPLVEGIEKSKILSNIKDEQVFVINHSYLADSYYRQQGKHKHKYKYLYLVSAYVTFYSEKLEAWGNTIPQVQKNPKCVKFFFKEDLSKLNSLHYILIENWKIESVQIEFPLIKSEYVVERKSDIFTLYRKK